MGESDDGCSEYGSADTDSPLTSEVSLVGGGGGGGGGGVLVSLGSGGGVPDVSDKVSLGGVVDPPSLLPGKVDPPDGSGLGGGASLEAGSGTLGVDASGWLDVVDGMPLSVGDGRPEGVEPSDPADSGDVLGALGGGDPLGGGGGSVTELLSLAPLGVISEVVDDGAADGGGLAEPADGGEPGEADGKVDGTSVEEVSTPELG